MTDQLIVLCNSVSITALPLAKCDQRPCTECSKKLYVGWSVMPMIFAGEALPYCMHCALPFIMNQQENHRIRIHDAMRGDLLEFRIEHFSSVFMDSIREMRDE